jgi:hypothetical protein
MSSGRRGRWFKSSRPDFVTHLVKTTCVKSPKGLRERPTRGTLKGTLNSVSRAGRNGFSVAVLSTPWEARRWLESILESPGFTGRAVGGAPLSTAGEGSSTRRSVKKLRRTSNRGNNLSYSVWSYGDPVDVSLEDCESKPSTSNTVIYSGLQDRFPWLFLLTGDVV